ncbi:MAG: UbiA family prenyltransferase [Candidatus Aenigmatarchaeota archaeon]
MQAYFNVLRPGNCLMTSVAVFIGALLVFGWNFTSEVAYPLFMAMAAAFLIAGAGNIVNDIADLNADKINRPKRPIPCGKISRRNAIAYAVALFIAGNIMALTINWLTLLIALLNTAVLIGYSATLQHKVYVGNIAVSYMVASSFLFGGAALDHVFLPLIISAMAFFANLAREIVKDLEDMEGDKFNFIRRVKREIKKRVSKIAERFNIKNGKPVLSYDPRIALIGATTSLMMSVIISPIPYTMGILKLPYLLFVVPADIVMLLAVAQVLATTSKKSLAKASNLIKIGMLLGLFSFIAGVLF